jgi:hypothetical protein
MVIVTVVEVIDENVDVQMCVDCASFHANGDLPFDEESAVRVAGSDPNGVVVVGDGEPFFSWAACDVCGDRRGGDRFDGVVVPF